MSTGEIVFAIINTLILSITAFFIFKTINSPVEAVKVGRQLNNEQQKDNAKRNLFLTLFALRGSPVSYDFVKGLNQIDVVFEDNQSVLDSWHLHYDSLQIKGQANEIQVWSLQRANLLSAMATSLGYSRIRQTDMIRDYYPEGHDNQLKDDLQLRQSLFLYLKTGSVMQNMIIEQMNANKTNQNEEQM